jgi:GMP synthase-like glutamine amidotransferase
VRTLAISHQRDAGPGVFADAIGELDVWHVAETTEPPADPFGYDAVLSFGGAMHADQGDDHAWMAPEIALLTELLEADMPLLGVCLGAQLLTVAAGGRVARATRPEIGWHPVELTEEGAADPLLAPLAPGFEAFQWHSYECLPGPDATLLATSPVCAQAFRIGERAWGIQFHAEVSAADLFQWADDYAVDPDAVAIGIDPVRLRAESEPRVNGWNELGRGLCGRFVEVASVIKNRSPGSSPHDDRQARGP